MQVTTALTAPVSYRVEDIQQLLGIGRNSAYNLVKQDGFPRVRVGSRIIIPADLFHAWVEQQATKGATLIGER